MAPGLLLNGPGTEQVPLNSKSLCKNIVRAPVWGTHDKHPLSWGGWGHNQKISHFYHYYFISVPTDI